MQRPATCIERVEQWIGRKQLKLNRDKTQIMGIRARLLLTLPLAIVHFSTKVSDLVFVINSQLIMLDHVAQLVLLSTAATMTNFSDARCS